MVLLCRNNLGQSSVSGLWNVADNGWRVVRFFVDVEWNFVRLVEWRICSSRQIERHIKEVNDFFVGFDGDFKAILVEDITKILLDFSCLTARGIGYTKTVLSMQAKIAVMCVSNVV